jgi:DNA polymerase I-like protein with 3'-5' exonuclease and polymerase domains
LRRIDKDGKSQIVYDSRRGEISIWGGAVVENVVQALARIVVGKQMLTISEKYRVALTVHDAAVVVVQEDVVPEAVAYINEVMSTPPDWATNLPVACETKVGATYGDC